MVLHMKRENLLEEAESVSASRVCCNAGDLDLASVPAKCIEKAGINRGRGEISWEWREESYYSTTLQTNILYLHKDIGALMEGKAIYMPGRKNWHLRIYHNLRSSNLRNRGQPLTKILNSITPLKT